MSENDKRVFLTVFDRFYPYLQAKKDLAFLQCPVEVGELSRPGQPQVERD
jgi:hypothetical protein